MRLPLLILLFPLSLALAACDNTPRLEYTYANDVKWDSEATKQAIKSFEASCPTLVSSPQNTDALVVSLGQTVAHTPDYGWHKGFNIKFHVVPNPVGDHKWVRAANHSCWADIGGGLKPGVDIYKPTCATLCSGSEVDRLFYPDSKLSLIESREDATAVEKERISTNAAEKEILLEVAFGGDYQAQRNVAYGYATGTFGSEYDPVKGCAWYMIVIVSKHKQVNSTDAGNYKTYCERLPKPDYEKALNYAESLKAKIVVK